MIDSTIRGSFSYYHGKELREYNTHAQPLTLDTLKEECKSQNEAKEKDIYLLGKVFQVIKDKGHLDHLKDHADINTLANAREHSAGFAICTVAMVAFLGISLILGMKDLALFTPDLQRLTVIVYGGCAGSVLLIGGTAFGITYYKQHSLENKSLTEDELKDIPAAIEKVRDYATKDFNARLETVKNDWQVQSDKV